MHRSYGIWFRGRNQIHHEFLHTRNSGFGDLDKNPLKLTGIKHAERYLGGGFKHFFFSRRKLGKIPILTSKFCRWEVLPPTRIWCPTYIATKIQVFGYLGIGENYCKNKRIPKHRIALERGGKNTSLSQFHPFQPNRGPTPSKGDGSE